MEKMIGKPQAGTTTVPITKINGNGPAGAGGLWPGPDAPVPVPLSFSVQGTFGFGNPKMGTAGTYTVQCLLWDETQEFPVYSPDQPTVSPWTCTFNLTQAVTHGALASRLVDSTGAVVATYGPVPIQAS